MFLNEKDDAMKVDYYKISFKIVYTMKNEEAKTIRFRILSSLCMLFFF